MQIANSSTMLILCGTAILLVILQAVAMLRLAWKNGKKIGLETDKMTEAALGSALFSIIPSLPVIVSYLLLTPALGRFFPWLRLSVVGSAVYETMAANMAAQAFGYENIFSDTFPADIFIGILFVISAGIVGGMIVNIFFLKRIDAQFKTISASNEKIMPVLTTAVFLGLYGTFAAPYITAYKELLTFFTFVFSGCSALLLQRISRNHPKLQEFNFPLSLLSGMAFACLAGPLFN